VTVQQKLTSITVSPANSTIKVLQQVQFTATALDQFGAPLLTQPKFTWSDNGKGAVSSTGLYTAPRRAGGPWTIGAAASGIKGTAKITVVN